MALPFYEKTRNLASIYKGGKVTKEDDKLGLEVEWERRKGWKRTR